jgi:hypothetical protein
MTFAHNWPFSVLKGSEVLWPLFSSIYEGRKYLTRHF